MRRFFVAIFDTNTFKQSSVTFSGTAVNGVLGALFYISAARVLGPSEFGVLFVAITTMTLVSDICNLGTDTGLVRFVGRYIREDREKAYRFLKFALKIKIYSGLAVLILGWLLAPVVADQIFQKPILSFPLQLASIGVLGMLLFSFSTSGFQALSYFWRWGIIQVGTNGLRLAAILILWLLESLSLSTGMVTYIAFPFVGFFLALFFLPRGFLKVSRENSVGVEFFHYSKWVAVFTVLAAVSSRLDMFLSARLLPDQEVGLYAAASQLVAVVPQFVSALGVVIAPKMAGMVSREELMKYFRKVQLLVCAFACFGLASIPVAWAMIPVVYGSEFVGVAPLFAVLALAMLVFLVSLPVHSAIFYYFAYPKLFVWVSLGHMSIVGILGWFLTSQMGAMGAAVTVLIGMVFNFMMPLTWFLWKVLK